MDEPNRIQRAHAPLRLGVLAIAGLALLLGVILVVTGMSVTPEGQADDRTLFIGLGAVLVVAGGSAGGWSLLRRSEGSAAEKQWSEQIARGLQAWNLRDDTLTARQRAIALVLVSVLSLFFELVLIRLLGAEIKVFAFLKNVVLIAAFLGLGLGFFLAPRRVGLLPLFLPGAALLIGTVVLGAATGVLTHTVLPGGDELVLLGLSFTQRQAAPIVLQLLAWAPYYALTLFYFVCVVLVFIPLGQYTGKCMRAFAPIPAYSLNLVGALAGTLLFAGVSFLWLPPVVWFAVAALLALPLLRARYKWLWRANLAAAAAIVLLQFMLGGTVWSPYNKLVVTPLYGADTQGQTFQWGYQLGVGEYYYQDMADLSESFFAAHPNLPLTLRYSEYEVPYAFAKPASVLILGAGSGNDVAAAKRYGAQSVDAVDIDPAIIELGAQLHPEKPYAASNVIRHANDARAFLRQGSEPYDLVLFGLLDSQQVLSAFGSVRLDNFVYTVEGMRDAFARVKPNGMLVVTFELFQPWMGQRIRDVLREATGQTPTILSAYHGTVFLIRKETPITDAEVETALAKLGGVVTPLRLDPAPVSVTTDDYPYLYLRERTMPFAYWTMLPLLGLVSFGIARQVWGRGWKIQGRFFWLGAAFLLMEVRIIAQVALLFGSTWLVNAAAIAAVLVMAVAANLLIARLPRVRSVTPWAILLLVTLALSSLVPPDVFLNLVPGLGGWLAALFLALPLFFAGMVFSGSLRTVQNVDTAMASNLLGSILGGLMEYLSLILGIGSLGWIALALYALALASRTDKSASDS